MAQERYKRRLVAIVSADVKGYSRLMNMDEDATIRTLTKFRNIITDRIEYYQGRVVDITGDNLLAIFPSVVDAVNCAVVIQRKLAKENADLSDTRKMEFRIGINLGDIIEEGERIYGNDVNMAARLEELADGGGICISGTAYDQVEAKLGLTYEYLGKCSVKNMYHPIRAYKIIVESETPPAWQATSLKIPDRPSIAVLPFKNMSEDIEQEYFSDGITEDLITDLSKISGLFVIARNSVFTYKGKDLKADQVGRELGVRFVLEGSVRKAGERIRITAQLVDATTEDHLWAERYDRDLEDIFALQDDVTKKIVDALAVTLTQGEKDRLGRKYTSSVDAYDYLLRGWTYFNRYTKRSNELARLMFQNAIDLDTQFAYAYVGLGTTYYEDWSHQWNPDPRNLERAFELAQKALAMDNSLPEAQGLLGHLYVWRKEHDKAIAAKKKVIAVDPNNALGYVDLAQVLIWADQAEEAIELVEQGMRLNPYYPAKYLWVLGFAYGALERYEEGIDAQKRALTLNPDYLASHAALASFYALTGHMYEAQAEAEEVMRLSPYLTLDVYRERLPFKDKVKLDRFIHSLGKAGLK